MRLALAGFRMSVVMGERRRPMADRVLASLAVVVSLGCVTT